MPTVEALSDLFRVRWAFERTSDGILTVIWKQPPLGQAGDKGPTINVMDALFAPGQGPSLQVADELWSAIARDRENKVVILTGYEGKFYDVPIPVTRPTPPKWDASLWETVLYRVPRSMLAFLDIPTLLIGAAAGPATIHAEYLLLCDIVVAAESAVFADRPHFISNAVPGDGVNVIWPLLLGWNRGRDFLLTGQELSAWEAKDLGLVREVVPDSELLPRCTAIARELLRQDELTLRYSAPALRQQLKVQVLQHLQHALALEGILKVHYTQTT
jgi:enoyl-CoA hydratase/carnithine racemase